MIAEIEQKRETKLKEQEQTNELKKVPLSEATQKIIKKKTQNKSYVSPIDGWTKHAEKYKKVRCEPKKDASGLSI